MPQPTPAADQSGAGDPHLDGQAAVDQRPVEPDSSVRAATTSNGSANTISDSHAEKLDSRRYHWIVEWRILGYTAAGILVLLALTVASYAYHSGKAATTFLSRADEAAAQGKYADEVRWLSSYLLLHPDDKEKIIRAAISADAAADDATREEAVRRVSLARKRLGVALTFLGATEGGEEDPDAEVRTDLRKRLIERLLETGGYYYMDAERHVSLLGASHDDPDAHRWLALALVGQVEQLLYQDRDSKSIEEESDYYGWLANQPPGIVLREAILKNPGDLGLAGAFIALIQSDPELFGIVVAERDNERDTFLRAKSYLDKESLGVLDSVLLQLHASDQSRAKILLYRYATLAESAGRASEVIRDAAAVASKRLSQVETEETNAVEGKAEEDLRLTLSPETEALVWDYQCVLMGAASFSNSSEVGKASRDDIGLARSWFKQLRDLGRDAIPVRPQMVKQVYLASGLLEEANGKPDLAVKYWRDGLKVVNDDNLDLLGNIAWSLAKRVSLAEDAATRKKAIGEANAAIEKFDEAIGGKKDELMLTTSNQISRSDRLAVSETIKSATWKKRIAEATVIAGEQEATSNDQMIIGLLKGITGDEIEIEPQIRLTGISLLTDAFQRQGSMDLAAETLADAADLYATTELGEQMIRLSGEAWSRSGNRLQANKQWKRTKLSKVPSVKIASLKADFANELRQLPDQRDFVVFRSRVEEMMAWLEAAGDGFSEEKLELKKLEAQLPPEGVAAETFLASSEFAEEIAELADANLEDVELQIYAAERFATAGDGTRADEFVQRVLANEAVPASSKALLRARVSAALGEHRNACEILLSYISDNASAATATARIASNYASRAGDIELAKRALLTIESAKRTPPVWFDLYQVAQSQGDSKEAAQYLDALHQAEGYKSASRGMASPAYSIFVEATAIAEKLLARGDVQRDEPDYLAAQSLVNRLLTLRPNWGNAVSLGGWLAFARGDYASAIEKLRRGINTGDRQLKTRQLLWRALLVSGKGAEAQREIERASIAMQTELDPYDQVSIGLMLDDGSYAQSLDLAKEMVDSKPDDPFAHLIYANVAINLRAKVLEGIESSESLDAEELLTIAEDAISAAGEIAKDQRENTAVAAARMQLAISNGKPKDIRNALDLLNTGDLKRIDRLVLAGRGLIALGEVDQAVDKLTQANELGLGINEQLELVRLLGARGRAADAAEVLRGALERDPNNPRLRTELAKLLVSSGQEIDWDEISQTLNDDRIATEQSRWLYALFLASKGDHFQKLDAVRLLRSMSGNLTGLGLNAARVQALLMFEMVEKFDELRDREKNSLDKDQYLAEARSIFKELAERDDPAIVDISRYAAFLIAVDDDGDAETARGVIRRLEQLPDGIFATLPLEIVIAKRSVDSADLNVTVTQWVNGAKAKLGESAKGRIETVAGEVLIRAGLIEEGIEWYQMAYEVNPGVAAAYFVALTRGGKFEKAAEIAAESYEVEPSASTASLLIDALLGLGKSVVAPRYSEIIEKAMQEFPDHAGLHESVATWALQKGDRERAIALYLKTLRLDERRLRTLNNLAMIFAEMPGRELQGLSHINKAIEIAGEGAELLDTKGTVLLRAGKLDQAAEQFERAIERGDEAEKPRYQFHRVQTLVALGRKEDARRVWSEIDFEKLDPKGLTSAERKDVQRLHQEFGTAPAESADAA